MREVPLAIKFEVAIVLRVVDGVDRHLAAIVPNEHGAVDDAAERPTVAAIVLLGLVAFLVVALVAVVVLVVRASAVVAR
jgi:hypothetical protein